MKSITIHKLDNSLMELIKARAKERGESLNKVTKKLLEQALGVRLSRPDKQSNSFREFCGVWSKKEQQEFDNAVSDNEEIDIRDWQ